MADPDQINAELIAVEVLGALRARLKRIEAGEPPDPIYGPDYEAHLRADIADLEAKTASFPKE